MHLCVWITFHVLTQRSDTVNGKHNREIVKGLADFAFSASHAHGSALTHSLNTVQFHTDLYKGLNVILSARIRLFYIITNYVTGSNTSSNRTICAFIPH